MGHGTHVAGIIAARGAPPHGLSGLAPGVTLYSFRVFGQGKRVTTNYEVVKAIIFAVEEGCDLLNLSLGGLPPDEVIRDAILDAGDQGVLVIASAGNDNRQPVTRPASYVPALAVSAFGRMGTFPAGSYEEGYVDATPPGADPADFMASFTNIGRDVFLTAPGVGILSTVSGAGYAPMSGTSMACPAVTGYAARLLSANPAVLVMPRDAQRTRAITSLLSQNAVSLGFPFDFEGFGRPK
jgi:subtilisin